MKDYEQVMTRLHGLAGKVEYVTDYLKGLYGHNVTAVSLLSRAAKLEQELGITMDRLARRNRQALFCWFTENWDLILPILTRNSSKKILNESMSDCYINFLDVKQLLNYH
ncbi:hypothetical protein TVAG_183690 [Trichomonas vaginalis G3]|uniref:Uncharacterized protein n=1 Tax=Trichomonas vaginalis (strain ATCC PRA-98 / G3) TaxID=412133 RepID=A2D9A6_TRIV3|nr:hypothetical protein TVAGG3_0770530 [Trichomonas vaginalis G3]EAY23132.1 hypothetical protein TVAG_183690 [Trichomonas vaginalis G3]KAI5513801.1 hypothetical protein TVAGG3_0770530 [Trichomonas vaginalis G3]|eukprot:XP_001584118.1 hypothetical protein [Trichomonas vaginalis G3]